MTRLLRVLAPVLIATAFALAAHRLATVLGVNVGEAALWGGVAGLCVAIGDRRTRKRERSGVIGSTVDRPPAHTIIRTERTR
mgnify:FL=1